MSLYVLMYRRLFGVLDVITDMTRSIEMVETLRLIYWNVIFGHRMSSGGYQINTGETGRLPEPPGGYWASWAQVVEEERRPARGARPVAQT